VRPAARMDCGDCEQMAARMEKKREHRSEKGLFKVPSPSLAGYMANLERSRVGLPGEQKL